MKLCRIRCQMVLQSNSAYPGCGVNRGYSRYTELVCPLQWSKATHFTPLVPISNPTDTFLLLMWIKEAAGISAEHMSLP